MAARVLDGRALAAAVRAALVPEVAVKAARHGRPPGLAVVLVGDDPASHLYVRRKREAAAEVGIATRVRHLPATVDAAAAQAEVAALSAAADVDAMLVQLPLPPHLDPAPLLAAIDPAKDADGLHPLNGGRLLADLPGPRPCTPAAVLALLAAAGASLRGARATIVGRGAIVGRPLAVMLAAADATVTVCHSHTRDLRGAVASAEILVAAAGQPELIPGAWVHPGAHVIDVGINRVAGRLVGDVDYAGAALRAATITPVPGGVGPMTVAMLLRNCVAAMR